MTAKRKPSGKEIADSDKRNNCYLSLEYLFLVSDVLEGIDEMERLLAVGFVGLVYDRVWGGQGGWLGSWSYLEDIDGCLFMDKSHKSSFL
ncbi:hypothetical protein YC2023_121814 [Brassica napus]